VGLEEVAMTFDKPYAAFDIESTGTDPVLNRILTLDITRTELSGKTRKVKWQFNGGGQRMDQEVIDIHGITNEMAATWPAFDKEGGEDIQAAIKGCDLLGYNCLGFDITMLNEELVRVGLELDLKGRRIFDACVIFKEFEKRTLTAARKFFCGKEHGGAHDSGEDVAATIEVFLAQLERYPELMLMTPDEVHKLCVGDRVDINGTIRMKNGVPVFGTKRNRNVPVRDDVGYAHWMLDKGDFPTETKRVIRQILGEGELNYQMR